VVFKPVSRDFSEINHCLFLISSTKAGSNRTLFEMLLNAKFVYLKTMKKLIFANAQHVSQEIAQIIWVGNLPVHLVRNPRNFETDCASRGDYGHSVANFHSGSVGKKTHSEYSTLRILVFPFIFCFKTPVPLLPFFFPYPPSAPPPFSCSLPLLMTYFRCARCVAGVATP